MKKKPVRFILIFLVTLFTLTGAMGFLIYHYRNQIMALAVNQLNGMIQTPVRVEKIQLDLLEHFPQLTLRLYGVEMAESSPVLDNHLFRADQVRISFRLYDLLKKNYRFNSLSIKNGSISLATDSSGVINYRIFRKPAKSSGKKDFFSFQIDRIDIENTGVLFQDRKQNFFIEAYLPSMAARLSTSGDHISVKLDGHLVTRNLVIREISYLEDENTQIATSFVYNGTDQDLLFDQSSFRLNGYEYMLNGKIGTTGNLPVELAVSSPRSDLKAITALLPEKYRSYLSRYRSRGEVRFNGRLSGDLQRSNPVIEVFFAGKEVSLFHPDYKRSVDHVHFNGSFTNGELRNASSSVLEIKDIKGELEGHLFSGDLLITDFNRIHLESDFSADLDLETLLEIFPVKNIRSGQGSLTMNANIKGPLVDGEGRRSGKDIKASGEIILKNAELLTDFAESSFRKMNGIFYFNNADLAIENFTGNVGRSDFGVSGFFKNIIPFVLLPDQPIRIEADFRSRFLDLNELLQARFSQADEGAGYRLNISPLLDIDFNCHVRQVILKRFNGRDIDGKLRVNRQVAVIEDARIRTMGGTMNISGSLSGKHPEERELLADARLDNIYLDSVFYVFENFNQDFLVDRHLRGQVNADINTYLILNHQLELDDRSLVVFADLVLMKGELIGFDPIQNLSAYLDAQSLKHLHFSELRNEIVIRDRTIFLPEMEISSDVSTLAVSGTHTFNQEIEYHFRIPLNQFSKPDPDSRFGEVAEDESGNLNMFLKMAGTTNDFKVVYDTQAVKKKLKEDFKREGRELKKIFSKKDTTGQKQLELADDEYFEED